MQTCPTINMLTSYIVIRDSGRGTHRMSEGTLQGAKNCNGAYEPEVQVQKGL